MEEAKKAKDMTSQGGSEFSGTNLGHKNVQVGNIYLSMLWETYHGKLAAC
jgi:hypothetical protein